MRNIYQTIIVLIFLFSVLYSCQKEFRRDIWLKNNDFLLKNNPRVNMMEDLKLNFLKKGMSKDSILSLLGQPSKDTIELVLPQGLVLPDSLQLKNKYRLSKKGKRIEYINEWYKDNYISTPVLSYVLGWSLIDPISLKIILDNNKKLVDYKVIEH